VIDVIDVFQLMVQLLGDPIVRALTTILAVISFAVSMLAFRRTSAVMSSHYANMRAEQERFLEMQWSRLNSLIVTNADCAALTADMFGIDSASEVRKEMLHRSYINVLASAYSAQKNDALDALVYEGHMQYFFSNYKGDGDYLLRLIETAHFQPGFEADCRARLVKRDIQSQVPHILSNTVTEQFHLPNPQPVRVEASNAKV
jgi:hypothetical protein